MSRYDGLGRMREAKFATQITAKPVTKKVTENTPVTENVTLNTPVTINPVTVNTPIPVTPKLKRGRPKTGMPSPAQNVPAATANASEKPKGEICPAERPTHTTQHRCPLTDTHRCVRK